MLKRQEDGLVAYEGYCIDLLNELAKTLHFTYNIKPSPDGFFGVETINGSWNGMIGELLNKVRNKKQTLPDRGARQVPHFSYRNFPWALKDASFFYKNGNWSATHDPRDTKDQTLGHLKLIVWQSFLLEGTKHINHTCWEVTSSYSMRENPFTKNYKLNNLWLIFDSI